MLAMVQQKAVSNHLNFTTTKKSTLVLSTSKTFSTQFVMTDFYLMYCQLMSVDVFFKFNKELAFKLYTVHKNWPKSNTALSIL